MNILLLSLLVLIDVLVFWIVNSHMASDTEYYLSKNQKYARIWFSWNEFREYTDTTTFFFAIFWGVVFPISFFALIAIIADWDFNGYHPPKTKTPKRIFAKQ